jgi:hypothetical protein
MTKRRALLLRHSSYHPTKQVLPVQASQISPVFEDRPEPIKEIAAAPFTSDE